MNSKPAIEDLLLQAEGTSEEGKHTRNWNRAFHLYNPSDDHGTVRSYNEPTGESSVKPDQFGFTSLAEAEAIATREYTRSTQGSIHTALIQKNIALPPKLVGEWLSILQEQGFRLLARDFSVPFREGPGQMLFDSSIWVGPKGVFAFRGVTGERKDQGYELSVTSEYPEIGKEWIQRWVESHEDPYAGRISRARISGVFLNSNGGMSIRRFTEPVGWPVEVDNYALNVRQFYQKLLEELPSREPSGRLAILEGPPGTGKTFLLRGLVHELAKKAEFIYLPANMVDKLDGPAMLTVLDRDEPSTEDSPALPKILVIEDADECLIARGPDNMSQIRNLLNCCDGFLGALLDIRVLATTNSGHLRRTDKLDDALLRPGRLLGRTTVGPLLPDQVVNRLRSLTGKEPSPEILASQKELTLANVYSEARKMGWKP